MFANLDFRTDVVPFIVATVGEFVALFFWLRHIDNEELLLANFILWAGFMVERVSVVLWMQYIYRVRAGQPEPPPPIGESIFKLFFFTLSEIIIWVMWALAAQEINQLVAAILLFPLLQVQHAVEMAILKKTNAFLYMTDSNTLFFTLMEVLGAAGWPYFVRDGNEALGGLALLIGLSVEHIIQGATLKPERTTPATSPA